MLICELRGRYFEQTRESANSLVTILHELGVGCQITELTVT